MTSFYTQTFGQAVYKKATYCLCAYLFVFTVACLMTPPWLLYFQDHLNTTFDSLNKQ